MRSGSGQSTLGTVFPGDTGIKKAGVCFDDPGRLFLMTSGFDVAPWTFSWPHNLFSWGRLGFVNAPTQP